MQEPRGKYCEPSVWLYLSVPHKSVRWRKFFNFSVQAKVGQIEKLRFSEFSLGPKFWAREIPSFEDLQVLDPYQLDLRVRVGTSLVLGYLLMKLQHLGLRFHFITIVGGSNPSYQGGSTDAGFQTARSISHRYPVKGRVLPAGSSPREQAPAGRSSVLAKQRITT